MKTEKINGATEAARNHRELIISVREPTTNNPASNAGTNSDLATSNSAQHRTIFAPDAPNADYARPCKSSEVNVIQDEQDPEQSRQDANMAAYMDYLQAGALSHDGTSSTQMAQPLML